MNKDLPPGWEEASLFDFCRPKQWPTIATKMLSGTGYPVYGANGVIGHHHEYNHEHATILITCRGATCGTINVCKPKSWINGNAMALDDLRSDVVDFRYAVHALRNRGFADVITGTAQPQITRAGLEPVRIALAPLDEQRRIVHKIEGLMARSRRAKEALEAIPPLLGGSEIGNLGRLNRAILAKAFRGELVPQDPNDEPASLVLERIRAERQASTTKKKRGRVRNTSK